MTERNLMMPGNPRYQPKNLQDYFGHDNLALPIIEVELAGIDTLADLGVIPAEDHTLLTDEVRAFVRDITWSEVEELERSKTKHDIRALVQLMQARLPEPLRKWVHVPFTSYDALDTARALMFKRAHAGVVQPQTRAVINDLRILVNECAHQKQVGRTHGQHALPITVGFWLATILNRLVQNARQMDHYAEGLVGKISGAVGAYNAQVGLGFYEDKDGVKFEDRVLEKLGLKAAPISTQIVPPEPMANYLWSVLLQTAALGQLGEDCRNLMRTEIDEIMEPFSKDQVGSSTMAHKRNPITYENTSGMFKGAVADFQKVLFLLVSEHQRDLVGSSIARDMPDLVIHLVQQLNTLLRSGGEHDLSFIRRIGVNVEALDRNLAMSGSVLLAEPLYLALQMAGYKGDAHHLVNHDVVPHAKLMGFSLVKAMEAVAGDDSVAAAAWEAVPPEVKQLLGDVGSYTGAAAQKAHQITADASAYLAATAAS
jgi:adenylosuccinate lyase